MLCGVRVCLFRLAAHETHISYKGCRFESADCRPPGFGRTLEAAKQDLGDPPALVCRLLLSRHGTRGGLPRATGGVFSFLFRPLVRGRKRNEEHLRLSHEAHGGRASFGRRKTSQSSVQGVFAEAKPRQKRRPTNDRPYGSTVILRRRGRRPRRPEASSPRNAQPTGDHRSPLREGRGYAP